MSLPERSSGCPPDLALERLLLGEIAGSSSGGWTAHVAGCSRCGERLAEMRRTTEAYAASPAAAQLRRLLAAREASGEQRSLWQRWRLWVAVPALAAAALVLVMVARRPPLPGEAFTAKGAGVMQLMVQRTGERSATIWDGAPLRKADMLQIMWTSAEERFVAVVARDDTGAVETIFPEDSAVAVRVAGGQAVSLGRSLRLDPRARTAVFHAFASRAPFALTPLLTLVRTQRPLTAADFAGQVSDLSIHVEP
jgi:hypothetical protein